MDILRWLELKKREIGFSHNALIIVAMFTMFLDHFAYMIIQNGKLFGYDEGLYLSAIAQPEGKKWFTAYTVLRVIGRISFPIYAFLIVEGFRRTSNVFKYILRVFILAIVSEIPFDLMIFNKLHFPTCFAAQNVLFTFVVALLMLTVIRIISSWPSLFTIFVAILAGIITFFIKSDYWLWGIILTYVLYMFRHDLNLRSLLALIITFMMTVQKYFGFGAASVFFMYFYDGTRGYLDLKRFHYLFYPLHMLILYGIVFFSNIYN